MDSATRQAIEAFKEDLRRLYGDRLNQVILYGSHARGEATEDSDVDLLIVLAGDVDPLEEIDRMADVAWEIDMEHNVLLSILPMSTDEFENRESPLLLNVRREGVPA